MSTQVRQAYVLTVNTGILPNDLTKVGLLIDTEIRSLPQAERTDSE